MYSLILYQPKTVYLFPADLLRLYAAVCVVVTQAAYRGVLFDRKTNFLPQPSVCTIAAQTAFFV